MLLENQSTMEIFVELEFDTLTNSRDLDQKIYIAEIYVGYKLDYSIRYHFIRNLYPSKKTFFQIRNDVFGFIQFFFYFLGKFF